MSRAQAEPFVCPNCESQSFLETMSAFQVVEESNLFETRLITCLGCQKEYQLKIVEKP